MTKKNLTDKGIPEHTTVFAQNQSFDNTFVAMDNPDDAAITQFGNGTTMVVHDNPDDVEDKWLTGV